MIARRKKPRHDLIVVLHSKSCDAAEKVVARLLKTRDHRGGDSTVIALLIMLKLVWRWPFVQLAVKVTVVENYVTQIC